MQWAHGQRQQRGGGSTNRRPPPVQQRQRASSGSRAEGHTHHSACCSLPAACWPKKWPSPSTVRHRRSKHTNPFPCWSQASNRPADAGGRTRQQRAHAHKHSSTTRDGWSSPAAGCAQGEKALRGGCHPTHCRICHAHGPRGVRRRGWATTGGGCAGVPTGHAQRVGGFRRHERVLARATTARARPA